MGATSSEREAAGVRTLNGSSPTIWHKSAPSAVRAATGSGRLAESWTAWKRYLAKRSTPVELAELVPGKSDPLGWALLDGWASPPRPGWLDRALQCGRADKTLENRILEWLGEASGNAPQSAHTLGALACCRALPRLAASVSPEVWWALLDHLFSTVADAAAVELEEDPLAHQLLRGELPLTLAYLLPEIVPCRRLAGAARRAVSSGLVDLLDGEGVPHAKHLAVFRPLMACWTRCCALGGQLKNGWCSKPARTQYEWVVRGALRLMRHDGSQVFSDGPAAACDEGLFKAALRFGGDDDDRQIAAAVMPHPRRRSAAGAWLVEAASHSEWAALSVLRPDWSRNGPRLSVVYPQRSVQMELGCGKDLVLAGRWSLEVRFEGTRLDPSADWEEVCWVSDDDGDFLELEIEFGGEVRVQRQMFLARNDAFLLLADAVLGPRRGELEYRSCLPLGPGVSFRQREASREGVLAGTKRRASVLPLALPEWQAERGAGGLKETAEGLVLQQSCPGGRLYAPLFLDLDRRRMRRPLTWRRLTVVQSREIQPPEVAAGYRVALGAEQWLIYRSLARRANRTLLGHNLSTEMLVAQFDETGEVEPLLEIE